MDRLAERDPFSSSFRATASGSPESSASSSSRPVSSSMRSSLKPADASPWSSPSSSRSPYSEGRRAAPGPSGAGAPRPDTSTRAARIAFSSASSRSLSSMSDQAGLAGLPEPVDALALDAGDRVFGLLQRVELLAGEELAVARDDLGPLRDLLLADPDGAPFLGALEQVALELGLVFGGVRTAVTLTGAGIYPRQRVYESASRLDRAGQLVDRERLRDHRRALGQLAAGAAREERRRRSARALRSSGRAGARPRCRGGGRAGRRRLRRCPAHARLRRWFRPRRRRIPRAQVDSAEKPE